MAAIEGDRVGAVYDETDDEVQFFGYGTYQGKHVPPAGVGENTDIIHRLGIQNPKILLDNGDTVWGCQCWWGSEAAIREYLAGKKVVTVRVADVLAGGSA